MADGFEDIRITGIDESRTKRADSPRPDLFEFHFTLSTTPDSRWTFLFEHAWRSTVYPKKCSAAVWGAYLVAHCALGEVEAEHFPRLKEAVRKTNLLYRDVLRHEREQQEKLQRAAAESEHKLRDLKKRLKFD